MFNPGDVVFGLFKMHHGEVLRHYSVVLASNQAGVVAVYVTSMKQEGCPLTRFSTADCRLGGFEKPSRWDASVVSVLPNEVLRKKGRITSETLSQIIVAYERARAQRTLQSGLLKDTEIRNAVPVKEVL